MPLLVESVVQIEKYTSGTWHSDKRGWKYGYFDLSG